MNYVISDVHGEYNLFIKLLRLIDFGDDDRMIICGDLIDKGEASKKLLDFVQQHSNITLIVGNHEHDFLEYCDSVMKGLGDHFDSDKVLTRLNSYYVNANDLYQWDDIDYLESCKYYYENDDCICVHAGVLLNENNEIMPLGVTPIEYFVYDRSFKEKNVIPKSDKCVFFGHTPSQYLYGESRIILYKREGCQEPKSVRDCYKVNLDCGTYLSGRLGCLRVDDMKQFYVERG